MAKKNKIKEKIKEGVREIKKKVAELEELEEVLDEIEGGIFDEDLEHVEEADEVSDFDIGSTMLSAAPPSIESWAGKDLEEEVRRGHNEWDWKSEEEFVGDDVYNTQSSGEGAYGATIGDAYSKGERAEGVYGANGSGAYSKGDSDEGSYSAEGGSASMKSYADLEKNRMGRGKSGLEKSGFEDKDKDFHRESHGLIKYTGKGAP